MRRSLKAMLVLAALAAACSSSPPPKPTHSEPVTAEGIFRRVKGGYQLVADGNGTWLLVPQPIPGNLIDKRVRVTGELKERNGGDCQQETDTPVQAICGRYTQIVVKSMREVK